MSGIYDVNRPHKEVLLGRAYNTATSLLVHELLVEDARPFGQTEAIQLYKNRLGKWFLVVRNEVFLNPANDDQDLRDRVVPLEYESAMRWMEKNCPQKIQDFFDVPEAEERGVTVSLRMPKELKGVLSTLAIKEGYSLNAWCIDALRRQVEAARSQQPG